jgi:tetratricopeptide (TPR) repeat protein
VEGARPDVLSWVKQHLSDTTAVLAAVRRHAAGPADAALVDAIRAHPFESAETPAQAVERAIRLAGQRGAVRVEPGEGAVDRDLLARWTPIFPVLDAAPADREAAADRAVARAEAHAPCSDRWGREYLAGYARLVGTGLALDGHDASALALLARALALSPDDPKTLHNLGVLLSDAGQPARGLDLLLRAVAVDPAYLRGWRSLAKIARAAGRDDLAAQADARARELEE